MNFHLRKELAISQIEDSHILLDLFKPDDCLLEQEASQFVQFNKQKFGVREAISEERDKIRNWMERRFFTVGEI